MLVPVKVSQGKWYLLFSCVFVVFLCVYLLNNLNKFKAIYLKFKLHWILRAVQLSYEGLEKGLEILMPELTLYESKSGALLCSFRYPMSLAIATTCSSSMHWCSMSGLRPSRTSTTRAAHLQWAPSPTLLTWTYSRTWLWTWILKVGQASLYSEWSSLHFMSQSGHKKDIKPQERKKVLSMFMGLSGYF